MGRDMVGLVTDTGVQHRNTVTSLTGACEPPPMGVSTTHLLLLLSPSSRGAPRLDAAAHSASSGAGCGSSERVVRRGGGCQSVIAVARAVSLTQPRAPPPPCERRRGCIRIARECRLPPLPLPPLPLPPPPQPSTVPARPPPLARLKRSATIAAASRVMATALARFSHRALLSRGLAGALPLRAAALPVLAQRRPASAGRCQAASTGVGGGPFWCARSRKGDRSPSAARRSGSARQRLRGAPAAPSGATSGARRT